MNNKEFISIVYEDDELLVINKPAGVLVHADDKGESDTVAGWVLSRYPKLAHVGEKMTLASGREIIRPGIVHRIDRETSGMLVICKTQDAFLFLKQQFQDRTIKKIYNAFVYGSFSQKNGRIDRPIGRRKNEFHLFSAEHNVTGKVRDALTEYTVVKTKEESSFLELRPKTGRTHQIRVHLKAVGHPVVCDKLYAPKRPCILGFGRLALHARVLSLHLQNGMALSLEAPFPDDFERALQFFA